MYDIILTKILPNALFIGVDYSLFWTLTPRTIKPFYEAFFLRQKYDDAMMWQQGAYIRLAIASTLSKNAKYPKIPNLSVEKPIDKGAEIKNKFLARMNEINARFKEV